MDKLIKRSLTWFCTAILILSLMGCDRIFPPSGDVVERISDGDTLTVKDAKGNKITVRFACMDARLITQQVRCAIAKRVPMS